MKNWNHYIRRLERYDSMPFAKYVYLILTYALIKKGYPYNKAKQMVRWSTLLEQAEEDERKGNKWMMFHSHSEDDWADWIIGYLRNINVHNGIASF